MLCDRDERRVRDERGNAGNGAEGEGRSDHPQDGWSFARAALRPPHHSSVHVVVKEQRANCGAMSVRRTAHIAASRAARARTSDSCLV